jgi:hypothetical protein
VEDFFYKCGPARLDAYMDFEVEECIRSLVNSVTYDKVDAPAFARARIDAPF